MGGGEDGGHLNEAGRTSYLSLEASQRAPDRKEHEVQALTISVLTRLPSLCS